MECVGKIIGSICENVEDLHLEVIFMVLFGAIHVLRNAVGGGWVSNFQKKVLRRCMVRRY